MKKITVDYSVTGKKDFICNSCLKVRVDGKFVKANAQDIITEALFLSFGCKISFVYPGNKSDTDLIVITKNGNRKKFEASYTQFGSTDTSEVIKEKFENLIKHIKNIENWIFEAHKVSENFRWEFE